MEKPLKSVEKPVKSMEKTINNWPWIKIWLRAGGRGPNLYPGANLFFLGAPWARGYQKTNKNWETNDNPVTARPA